MELREQRAEEAHSLAGKWSPVDSEGRVNGLTIRKLP